MEEFLQKMESIDSKERHAKNLDTLLLTYLSTPNANDLTERCEILVLVESLKELFM